MPLASARAAEAASAFTAAIIFWQPGVRRTHYPAPYKEIHLGEPVLQPLPKRWRSCREAEDLQQIEQSIQACRRIFGGMLALARDASQHSVHANLRRALDSMLAVLRDSLERQGIQVDVQLGDAVPNVQAAQGDLEQLFLNLATNARDAMPRGGVLSIRTESLEDHIAIFIRDTGCGIPADAMVRIQEPFFTTKRSGTGLGLSICRSIISNVGGRMEIESQVGSVLKYGSCCR